jgi:hypothetical protein
MTEGLNPLLFVAMPFGKKDDPSGAAKIDFDRIYDQAIRPAAERVKLDVIRADEERGGGIIHTPMFERLLGSEIVVADLTTLNPNVFYELGVRHCAKPRTTILIFARVSKLPFDVQPLRAVPYDLENGFLSDEAAAELREALEPRLAAARRDVTSQDSPIFQLLPGFAGVSLPAESAGTFRERALRTQQLREQLREARRQSADDKAAASKVIDEVQQALGNFDTALSEQQTDLLVDLLLAYRDIGAHDEVIALVDGLPPGRISQASRVRELHAFSLNRRKHGDDESRAETILKKLVDDFGVSPEIAGMIGRIYKDRYNAARSSGSRRRANGYLDEAIRLYSLGFQTDLRDNYPGINAATLLFLKGDTEALAELGRIRPAVLYSAMRRGGLASTDYWEVATILEAHILGDEWDLANQALERLLIFAPAPWMLKTTAENFQQIRQARAERSLSLDEIDDILTVLGAPAVEHAATAT